MSTGDGRECLFPCNFFSDVKKFFKVLQPKEEEEENKTF